MKTFFKEILLPLLAALFLAFLFKPVYAAAGSTAEKITAQRMEKERL